MTTPCTDFFGSPSGFRDCGCANYLPYTSSIQRCGSCEHIEPLHVTAKNVRAAPGCACAGWADPPVTHPCRRCGHSPEAHGTVAPTYSHGSLASRNRCSTTTSGPRRAVARPMDPTGHHEGDGA